MQMKENKEEPPRLRLPGSSRSYLQRQEKVI